MCSGRLAQGKKKKKMCNEMFHQSGTWVRAVYLENGNNLQIEAIFSQTRSGTQGARIDCALGCATFVQNGVQQPHTQAWPKKPGLNLTKH